jgi:hypothetical protein
VSTGPQTQGPLPAGELRETNGLAIATLVMGCIAFVPVAIVLGIIALRQIKRRGDRGRGLAITGMSIAAGWLVVATVAITFVVSNLVERDADGRITKGGYLNEIDLLPGDCLNDPTEDAVVLSAVPCDEPHDTEVFARFELKGDGYPGGDSVRRRATAGCAHRLVLYAPREYEALIDGVTYFSPDRIDWAIGDHDVTCFANLGSERTDPLDSVFARADRQAAGPVLY